MRMRTVTSNTSKQLNVVIKRLTNLELEKYGVKVRKINCIQASSSGTLQMPQTEPTNPDSLSKRMRTVSVHQGPDVLSTVNMESTSATSNSKQLHVRIKRLTNLELEKYGVKVRKTDCNKIETSSKFQYEMQTRSKRKHNDDNKIKNIQSVKSKFTTEPRTAGNKFGTHIEVQSTRQTRASRIRKRTGDKLITIETSNKSESETQLEASRKRRRNGLNQAIFNHTDNIKSNNNSKATAKKGRKSTKMQLQERMSYISQKRIYGK